MPELKRSTLRRLIPRHLRNVGALFRLMVFTNGARLAAPGTGRADRSATSRVDERRGFLRLELSRTHERSISLRVLL